MANLHNRNTRILNSEQQRLINMYINQYNQTNAHIDMLLDMLDEIRGNIFNVININQPRRTRINRHNRNVNANINRIINDHFSGRYYNNNIFYDYNNPINPNIYNELNMNDTYRNRRNHFFDMSFNTINRNQTEGTLDDYARSIIETFLNSTVTIRPTVEQIQNASRTIRFGDIENPLSEACPISLEEFNNDDQVRQLLPCGHIFHQQQFQEWFESNVRCPVCRYDIRNYRPLSRRNTPNNFTTDQSNNTNNNTNNINNTNNTNNNSTTINPSTQTVSTDTPINRTNNSQTTPNPSPISNINFIRDPISNEIEHLTFDIGEQVSNGFTNGLTNSLLDGFTRNVLQTLLNPHTQNNNDRFVFDPSNNIFLYETIIRPNSNQNRDNDNN